MWILWLWAIGNTKNGIRYKCSRTCVCRIMLLNISVIILKMENKNDDITLVFLSFFWSGHCDYIAWSVLGGFPKPRTAAIQSLDSVHIFRIMCYVPLMALVPPLFPLRDSPAWAPCLQTICPRMHLSLLLLPPLRPFFVYLPSPPVARLSPVVRPYDWLATGAMLPLVSCPVY